MADSAHEPLSAGPARLPARLRAGVEALSGLAMDDVRVHRNSSEPARLGALAFARGSDIHLAPGQEQHLPHEAWHVVQQKQGRVRATSQFKGTAISDDPTLESEADRMAPSVAIAGQTTAARQAATAKAAATPQAGDVVQCKILYQRRRPTRAELGASPVIASLDASSRMFWLRNDWSLSAPNLNLHFLLADKKYLLGEDHSKSTWYGDIKHWTYVSTMTEYETDLPRDLLQLSATTKGKGIPLESFNTRLLVRCLRLDDAFDSLIKPDFEPSLEELSEFVDSASKYESVFTAHLIYSEYAARVRAAPPISEVDAKICRFSKRLSEIYSPSLVKALKTVSFIISLDPQLPPMARKQTLARLLQSLDNYRSVLRSMIFELMDISAVAPESPEGRTLIRTALSGKESPAASLAAARPVRDQSMAEHVNRMPAPLLVRLGNNHLPGVASRVRNAVAVDKHIKLATFTEWPAPALL